MRYGVGVDLGGTSVKMGLFQSNGMLIDAWSIKTNTSDSGKNILIDIARSVSVKLAMKGIDKKQVDGLGIGAPGDVVDGVVGKCVNLGWENVNVEKELSTLCGLKVKVGNDANVAALGEYMAGSGADYESILLVTLGTGVGGGIVINGEILQGFCGSGGEIGHIVVNPEEEIPCNCGRYGCIEQYASATGIRRLALKKLEESSEDSAMREFGEDLTTKDVFDVAKEGDKLANEVVDYSMSLLGHMLAEVCHVINPEAVILGGGVTGAGQILIDRIEPTFVRETIDIKKDTKICLASLGEKAGIFGAFYLINC